MWSAVKGNKAVFQNNCHVGSEQKLDWYDVSCRMVK